MSADPPPGYHKPDEREQAIIIRAWQALNYQVPPTKPPQFWPDQRTVAVALGSDLIEDDSGRWTEIFGLPVVTDKSMDPNGIGILVQTHVLEEKPGG